MDLVSGIAGAVWEFCKWIAPAFWPAVAALFVGWVFKEARAKRDARQVTSRMQRQEYIEWKRSYLSGQLTNSDPSESDTDLNLRWFVVRREKKPDHILISNRGEATAWHVRAQLAESTGRAKWRWFIRPGKSMRMKIGKIPDKSIDGLALDIHWDDKKVLARKVTFIVPQSELELPKPAVSEDLDKIVTSGPSSANKAVPAAPPKTESTPVARPTPTSTDSGKPLLPTFGSSSSTSTATGGMHASTNIADRSIPNRTPGIPAAFDIIPDDGQLLLKNVGLGDASHVYLQPLDDDQFVVGGGFWLSIPAKQSEPFILGDPRDIGLHTMFFSVTWDDGFRLKRQAEVKIPTKENFTGL